MTRARTTDPETSHAAADSIDRLSDRQGEVYWVLARYGHATDSELVTAYNYAAARGVVSPQSPSGIRTRRSELVARGAVVDTGKRRTVAPSTRPSIVWRLA